MFVGLQASGKSTFYKEHYFNTHVRVSNDLLRTKNRERKILEFCFDTGMPLVIDNTNATKEIRTKYIELLRRNKYRITCYFFKIDLEKSLEWNRKRIGKEIIPDVGIFGMHKRMEVPCLSEGYDELFYVDFVDGRLAVKEWKNEV